MVDLRNTPNSPEEAPLDPRHTKNLLGKVFGRLLVVRFGGYHRQPNGRNAAYWWTRCSCGSDQDYIFSASRLISGNTKSHGCLKADVTRARHEIVRQSYIGRRQNHPNSRLEVIGIESIGNNGEQTTLRCLCHGTSKDHPRETLIRLSDFISCRVISCGCLWDEVRVAATRRRHADYREAHGFYRDQLMRDLSKTLRTTIKPLSFQVILRDGKRCLLCNTANYLEVHHCVPIHKDRTLTADPFNLATLCKRCHKMRAHAGNYRGPVDPAISLQLRVKVTLNEAKNPTAISIDLDSMVRQVKILFNYRGFH